MKLGSAGSARPPGLPSGVRWPLPPPSRPRFSWLLGIGLRRFVLRRVLRPALPLLRERPRILDLGAGTGADWLELVRLRPSLADRPAVLVEAQKAMLTAGPSARAGTDPGEWVLGDAGRLPFRDGSFDLVLSIGTLCCVAEGSVGRVVEETTRVLAPGGILVLTVPARRGRADDRATARTGLVRKSGPRPGRGVWAKGQ